MFKKGLLLILLSTALWAQEYTFKAEIRLAPVATVQLIPALFVPSNILQNINVAEGAVVTVTLNGTTRPMRIYWAPGNEKFIAMHKSQRVAFSVNNGEQFEVKIDKSAPKVTTLNPLPIAFHIEDYPGDKCAWQGYAFGAPHGDCDHHTGEIVKIVSEKYGIPGTAAYGGRFSYRGIWYDVNRPLMKLPKTGGGTIPDRVWNKKSYNRYNNYQQHVWHNNDMQFGKRFKLYCSFHGHDLTVKMPDGKRIERPVIEGITVGFSREEIRRIKGFYNKHKFSYYKTPPMLVFGNLPEDRTYYYKKIPMHFFYSGTGTRVYGALRSDLVEYALHLETPNTMRQDPKVRPQTARFLGDLYTFVRDSILAGKEQRAEVPITWQQPQPLKKHIPKGSFLMGAPKGVGWSAERPQHNVQLSAYKMDVYEVTNSQYAAFLNAAYNKGLLAVDGGIVKSQNDTTQIWFTLQNRAPLSQIKYENSQFKVQKGKEDFPVIYVSWFGAGAYAQFYGESLPTEAQWERAASWDATHNKKYLYGYGQNVIDEGHANFEDSNDPFENQNVGTAPVHYYTQPSSAGMYGMSGNVFEWCSDWYQYKHYGNEKEKVRIDPPGPDSGTMKTIRGGAWNHEPWLTRTTFRLGVHPNATLVNVGFRCVK